MDKTSPDKPCRALFQFTRRLPQSNPERLAGGGELL